MHLQPRFRDLIRLFFPIFFTLLLSSSLFFIQKLFFARLQPGVMEAGLNVIYAIRIFQLPCVLLAMMAQVSVARLYGAQEWKSIGHTLWQFIWFAILSNVIVIPLGILYWKLYFQGTSMEPIATPYYIGLIATNWLYPLGSALSCFYLGRGYTRVVVLGKIGTEFLALAMAYILIFGNQWIAPLGLLGGALAMGLGQLLYCGMLMILFLKQRHAITYGSRNCSFRFKLFWDSIRPGLLRAFGNISLFACWAAVWQLLMVKADADLRLISIGGTLFLFLSCFGDALCQSLTVMASQILGAQRYELLRKTVYLGTFLAIILSAIMGVFLLVHPNFLLEHVFSFPALDSYAAYSVLVSVWLCLLLSIFSCVPLSYILAFKDTQFITWVGVLSWVSGYLWMYYTLIILAVPPLHFWSLISATALFNLLLYAWRAKKLILQETENWAL